MTRIASVKAHAISAKLKHTLWTAHEELHSSSVVLVEIKTDDGLTGIGQIHGSPLKDICRYVEQLGEVARGMDATAQVAVWEKLLSLTSPRPTGMGGRDGLPQPLPRGDRPQIMAAIGGIDLALWDIKGKALNVPVWKLLGGEGKPLFTYATGGYYELDAPLSVCADELADFVKRGYQAVKLKTAGLSIEKEVERIRLSRAAIGKDVLLMLDMNAAYDLEDCIRFAHAVEPYDIYWLEEPLHWYLQPADFVVLAKNTVIPLAHGEREMTRFTARDFIVSGALGFMQFDSTRFAGFTESLRVSHLAEQHGVRVAPHLVPEVHAHLVSAFPRLGFGVESHGNADRDPLWFEMFTERAQVKDGRVHMNDLPGFGFEIDWKAIEKYRV
ncbi:MAG: mandelate racemase/muconate lactonizing enzyme family protein [Burkholderiales bacterium]|nr:mandelate racemase/muconate lactonizing enzyme family protein [Burkholderiales bacterium]